MELSSVRFRPHWSPDDSSQVIGLLHLVHDVFADNPNAARWLELGTYGGEAATLILGHPGVKLLHCVDSWPKAVALTRTRLAQPIVEGRCEVFLSKTQDFRTSTYDVVYVDADHSYEGCKADLDRFSKCLPTGGHLAGHDYHDKLPGVKQAVDEFRGTRHLRVYRDGSWLLRCP